MSSASFSSLKLIDPLLKAVLESGYTIPTPIQLQAIPPLLEGKDLLGCAQTGTGKTAAFALPLLQILSQNPKRTEPKSARVLILTPTRELAIQIEESFRVYGKHLRLKTAVVFGGVGQTPQVRSIAHGVDVLVATPGRLMDLIQQRYITLSKVEVFVLDEADRMLDMGFIHDIKKVLALLPKMRQTLFFSATMPKDIEQLANSMLTNPVRVEVTPVSSTAEMIEQSVMYVDKSKKRDLLRHVLLDRALEKVIVFTRTKHGANKVVEILEKNQVRSAAIHGNKSQSARQNALESFRAGKVRVLVATDIAARGIDVDGITHVINFEVPNVPESYVHRIGRTARAGAGGMAISFCDGEEKSFIRDIEKLTGQLIPVNRDHPYHSPEVENSRMVSSGKAKAMIEGRAGGGGGRNNRSRRPGPRGGGRGGSSKTGLKEAPKPSLSGNHGSGKAPRAIGPSTHTSSGKSRWQR
ncbi:MAG: DEAD/DEAH box helicase [Bdellovibrionota bacterium]